MSLCWNSRIIAEPSLAKIHGFKVAGGFGFRLGLEFSVPAWDMSKVGPMPTVLFYPAAVQVGETEPYALGRAFSETAQPFRVTEFGSAPNGVLFDIESARDLWRLQPLRRWSHEQVEQVLT